MMAALYLVYLLPSYEVHRIFVISSKEHSELPPIPTDSTKLFDLLFVSIQEKF